MRVLPRQMWRPDEVDGAQPDAEPVGDDLYSLVGFEAGENGNGHSDVAYQREGGTVAAPPGRSGPQAEAG